MDGITDSVDMSLSKLQEIVKGREARCIAVHEVTESDTTQQLNNKDKKTGLPRWLSGKESTCPAGASGSILEMATHSSILAWETPWTEEPGGL